MIEDDTSRVDSFNPKANSSSLSLAEANIDYICSKLFEIWIKENTFSTLIVFNFPGKFIFGLIFPGLFFIGKLGSLVV